MTFGPILHERCSCFICAKRHSLKGTILGCAALFWKILELATRRASPADAPAMEVYPMRRFALLGLSTLAAVTAFSALAEAQAQDRPLVLRVTPRSFLDPGTAAPVGSLNRYATQGQLSYMVSPPWNNQRDRFGEGVLPDPIGGPFVGARNPFADLETTGSIR
jgi:hypothetical protein